MTPLTFTALLGLVILFAFFVIGAYQFRQIKSYDSFYLRERSLEDGEYASSFAASSTSFATVLIWFITFASSEGISLLYCAITYLIGAMVFARLTPVLENHSYFSEGRTLGGYMHAMYESRSVALSITIVAAIGDFCILLIELYVGASLFSIYSKALLPGAVPIGVGILAIIVFCYTALGGFPGVVRSDKVQLSLIALAGLLVPLLMWISPPTSNTLTAANWMPQPLFSWPEHPLSQGRFIISLPLFINLLFVNILVFPAQLRQWQMAASCASPTEMRRGLIEGGIINCLLWGLFIILGIFVGVHFPGAGGQTPNFDNILVGFATADSVLLSYVAFPVLFCACLAALLSTADSAIIPLAQAITDDYIPGKYRNVWTSRLIILCVLAFTLALYYLVFVLLGVNFFSVLFALWGLLIILAPAVGFALLFPELARTPRGRMLAFISVWVGFFLTLGLVYYAETQVGVLYAGPIGVLVSSLVITFAYRGRTEVDYGVDQSEVIS